MTDIMVMLNVMGSDMIIINKVPHIIRRRNRGMSLIEAAMVLAIAALVVASVMLFFQNANNSQKSNDSLGQLAAIQQTTRSLFAGQPDYAGLTDGVLATSRQLPNRMVKNGNTLQHAFNGQIIINTDNNDQNFYVQYNNLPADACSKMATMDLGTGLFSIYVSGGTATTIQGRTLNPTEANTACGTANNAIVKWTFF